MFTFGKKTLTSFTAVSGKLVIRDLEASPKDPGSARTSRAPALRDLGADEILFVAGGRMKAGGNSCSGGREDDCPFP